MDDFTDLIATVQRPREDAEGRIYGVLSGVVVEVEETGLFRVKARLGSQGPNDSSGWLMPATPGSIESRPEKGEFVAIAFMDGDIHKGIYWYFPTKQTGGRPVEAMLLGNTFAGMWNYMVNVTIQQILTDVYVTIPTHVHPSAVGPTGTSPQLAAMVQPQAPGKINVPDGSPAPNKSGDQKALSKRARLK
jgi:hypothetical protein